MQFLAIGQTKHKKSNILSCSLLYGNSL